MIQTLNSLKNNPMFCLSLASKELFHSNFLEWLFNIDANKFIALIDDIAGTQLAHKNPAGGYVLYREKNNFDICITHKEKPAKGKEKEVYDIVLENKVKSIPYKKQLDEYISKINGLKQENVKFILLSLANKFPQKEEISEQWEIVNYELLKEKIQSHYGTTNIYVNDYCDFIDYLHKFQESALGNVDSHLFAQSNDYKPYRLHDIYIKMRCSNFVVKLYKQLKCIAQQKGLEVYFLENEYGSIREKRGIYLQATINKGQGTINVFLNLGDTNNDYIYEFVIQAGTYRHGINSELYNNDLSALWTAVKELSFIKDFNCSNYGNLSQSNSKLEYNHYGQVYVYKYLKTDGTTFDSLLDIVYNDVTNFIKTQL